MVYPRDLLVRSYTWRCEMWLAMRSVEVGRSVSCECRGDVSVCFYVRCGHVDLISFIQTCACSVSCTLRVDYVLFMFRYVVLSRTQVD
jgi:hypothetical protein